MHPLGATWNQMGINRRSKQVVYADDERTIDRQWTHIIVHCPAVKHADRNHTNRHAKWWGYP
jgi:hypothetical protein